jgi:malate dehydrogenase (oxaloacetate-decarboxylating)
MDPNAVPSHSLTVRVELKNVHGTYAELTARLAKLGAPLGAMDVVNVTKSHVTRDVSVNCSNEAQAEQVLETIRNTPGVRLRSWSDKTFLLHLGGKITQENKIPVRTREALSRAYTPGVARVCMAIAEDKNKAYNLTIKNNTVAVVSDGTAVLGLGDIGPEGAMPVMEGKAMLFKEFGGINAFPLCIDTKDPKEIIKFCQQIAPTFGGINLEDISAPRCFEIEDELKRTLDIPVFHDDQHGTAVVVLAGFINALKLVKKSIKKVKVVVSGVGASGIACSKILLNAGVQELIGLDSTGAVYKGRRKNMNPAKRWFAAHTNPKGLKGGIMDVIEGADLYLGLSGPGTFPVEALKKMAKNPIVFAMANPTPEIMPEEAAPYVRVMATGRSDYPNQINNVLCFPGIFRGALDVRASTINEEMKLAAAYAIANIIDKHQLMEDYIIPSVFDKKVATAVAKAVAETAIKTGVARREKVR